MKYEEMSDFEINAAVTSIIYDCDGWECNWTNECFFHCGVDGSGYYSQSIRKYCDNPSDAWPIIIENKIAVWPGSHGEWQATRSIKGKSHIRSTNKNPLRAAMICFLKMKDAEVK